MNWISYDGESQKLRDLPYGTILLVKDEFNNYDSIKVVGDGIVDQRYSEWIFHEPSLSGGSGLNDSYYKILKYAIPPQEYQDFLDYSVDELNKQN